MDGLKSKKGTTYVIFKPLYICYVVRIPAVNYENKDGLFLFI